MSHHLNQTLTEVTTNSVVLGDEFKLGILKICLFSTFFVLGLIGNSLVLIGIGLNKGMQTPTNLLIFNLALADVLFIIVCIPTTLFGLFGLWPFAEIGCKLAQFINHLSAFMSIYLLVFMSIDRYLAIVHAVDSISSYRTTKNTTISIVALWLIGICLSMIIGSLFTVIKYEGDQSTVSMYCMLRYLHIEPEIPSIITQNQTTDLDIMNLSKSFLVLNQTEENAANSAKHILPIEASLYWLGFVIFLYALPLTIIVILYGLMLKFLRGARGQSVGKSKRRATRMILAVILTYALCWFLMQLLFVSNVILSHNAGHDFATYIDILTMFANVFAYLNSCTNPILYGFMSKNFRSSFIDLLCCRYTKRRLFHPNESLRNRRAINNKMHLNSTYDPNDCLKRPSTASRYSQLQPLTSPTFNQLSHATTEMFLQPDDQTEMHNELKQVSSTENSYSCHITVGTQTSNHGTKSHRRRKHDDRSPTISYSPLAAKSSDIPCNLNLDVR